MSKTLQERSSNKCELCASSENLEAYEVAPSDGSDEQSIYICNVCKEQIESGKLDEVHFNFLNDSMWSETPAVVVMSYRLLNALGRQDLVDMIYMEETTKKWADAKKIGPDSDVLIYKDSNGTQLFAGDTVVVIKDLDVKGTSFVAKRGTAIRNIGLTPNDPTHIEGRVNGVKIEILTKYLKKS